MVTAVMGGDDMCHYREAILHRFATWRRREEHSDESCSDSDDTCVARL